ncbi:hypothetical protein [Pseudoalteromonas sp.]|uniref:hypothetical protein n=1 Tax=Pseudoalteromonas sp. TaxID=53249 RepID=UPI0035678EC2
MFSFDSFNIVNIGTVKIFSYRDGGVFLSCNNKEKNETATLTFAPSDAKELSIDQIKSFAANHFKKEFEDIE